MAKMEDRPWWRDGHSINTRQWGPESFRSRRAAESLSCIVWWIDPSRTARRGTSRLHDHPNLDHVARAVLCWEKIESSCRHSRPSYSKKFKAIRENGVVMEQGRLT
jgi:hypothetical protein